MRTTIALALGACFIPALAFAADAPPADAAKTQMLLDFSNYPGTVNAHATAHRRLQNTVADVTVSIELHGHGVAAVQRDLGTKSQALLGFLRAGGTERLQTDTIDVEPQTETDRGHGLPDRIVGYTGTLTVSFRAEVDKLPDLLDGSLAHGANTVGQVTLTPREDEIDAARQALAAEATTLAVRQLDAVAQAAGHKIAGIRSINVDPQQVFYGMPDPDTATMRAEKVPAPGSAAPVPVAVVAGQSDISITVAVTATLDK